MEEISIPVIGTVGKQMDSLEFFARHPVFTADEFVSSREDAGRHSRETSQKLLAYHVNAGRLVRVRRGLYAFVDPGLGGVDPYLVATKLARDAAVAYHAAMQFHGKAHSVWSRYTYLTRAHPGRFHLGQGEFVAVRCPSALRALQDMGGGFLETPHAGGRVRVASLERTLVDVLDAPALAGGWEEVWRSLESVEFFDLDAVVEHALRRGSSLTVGRVGFYLERHRDILMVEDRHLEALRDRAPRQPLYLDRAREPGKLVAGWNLIVPERVLSQAWEEAWA